MIIENFKVPFGRSEANDTFVLHSSKFLPLGDKNSLIGGFENPIRVPVESLAEPDQPCQQWLWI